MREFIIALTELVFDDKTTKFGFKQLPIFQFWLTLYVVPTHPYTTLNVCLNILAERMKSHNMIQLECYA